SLEQSRVAHSSRRLPSTFCMIRQANGCATAGLQPVCSASSARCDHIDPCKLPQPIEPRALAKYSLLISCVGYAAPQQASMICTDLLQLGSSPRAEFKP